MESRRWNSRRDLEDRVMTPAPSSRQRRRRFRTAALLAAVATVVLPVLPGTASAAPPRVVPQVDCFYAHDDGSVTLVLGYRSTYPTTQTIPRGRKNFATPATYNSSLPTTFEPGTHNGVAALRVSAGHLNRGNAWQLDGTELNYRSATSGTSLCTQAQLPAFANGAALTGGLVLAGIVGFLVVRRIRRATPRATSPGRTAGAPGGDHA